MFKVQRVWHQLWHSQILYNSSRHFAKKSKVKSNHRAMSNPKPMVHQELMRYVNPYARINVYSDIFVRIQPADVHQYTSGDALIAQLHGDSVKNSNVSLNVDASDDEKVVNVLIKKLEEKSSNIFCHLSIPVRADLIVEAKDNVRVEGIQSEILDVKTDGIITTKNCKANCISLFSKNGNIVCLGTLLGKHTEIDSHNGNIFLEKLQGNVLNCSTQSGNISTDCCYVEKSKFQTLTGRLELKNVHKTSEVFVHQVGEINMTGVCGTLNVVTKGGILSVQLSELMGENKIVADNLVNEAVIHISQVIEQDIHIDVRAPVIKLNDELKHVSHALNEDSSQFLLKNENSHQLLVIGTSEKGVRLGKQSWSDMMRQKLEALENSKVPT
ncbi:uncharacterized protein Dwil_GK23203 [Drosophila willistoni]|uniref:Uncharacterized protein n=1 Tax=Drosophila willistoni TaxID=7260 RepID=B4NMT6_DROWI|nr:protein FAM185A [Drosophila willistoni]EDW85675.2 uncharacterized protein Dwil_GK23203 [Drosophila willistoni]